MAVTTGGLSDPRELEAELGAELGMDLGMELPGAVLEAAHLVCHS